MTSQSTMPVAPPFSGSTTRLHPGGAALIAFSLLLWALFLGTVGAPLDEQPARGAALAAAAAGAQSR